MYTQCPECLAIYEIDEDALQASLGIVRCGHCSQRFDALRTLSDTLPAGPAAMLPDRDPGARTPTLTDAILPDTSVAASENDGDPSIVAAPPARPVLLPDAKPQPADDTWFAPLSGERARALIADAAGIPADAVPADPAWQAAEFPIQTGFAELDIMSAAPVGPDEAIVDATPSGATSDPMFTREPVTVEAADVDGANGSPADARPAPDFESLAAEAAPEPASDVPEPAPSASPFPDGGLPDPGGESSTLAATDAGIAEPEPVEIAAAAPIYVPPRRPRVRRGDWFFAFGCLVLALILAAQLGWAKRVALVRDPATQAWAMQVCAKFNCHLPPIRDTAKLELLSRDIRPDPDAAGALVITATVRNDAPFRQPWPIVVVAMTDLDNDVVAMRRFRPAEYMPDPARRRGGIAPGTTVAVAFEVADPGKRAVSYRFSFE